MATGSQSTGCSYEAHNVEVFELRQPPVRAKTSNLANNFFVCKHRILTNQCFDFHILIQKFSQKHNKNIKLCVFQE